MTGPLSHGPGARAVLGPHSRGVRAAEPPVENRIHTRPADPRGPARRSTSPVPALRTKDPGLPLPPRRARLRNAELTYTHGARVCGDLASYQEAWGWGGHLRSPLKPSPSIHHVGGPPASGWPVPTQATRPPRSDTCLAPVGPSPAMSPTLHVPLPPSATAEWLSAACPGHPPSHPPGSHLQTW